MEKIKQINEEVSMLNDEVQGFAGHRCELTVEECKTVLQKCSILRNNVRAVQADLVIQFLLSEAKLFRLWYEARSLKKNDKELQDILSSISDTEEILLVTMKVRGLEWEAAEKVAEKVSQKNSGLENNFFNSLFFI